MEDQKPSPPPQPPEDYDEEFAAFIERLRVLHASCDAPSYRTIEAAGGTGVPLSPSSISDLMNAKRLPKLDFLIHFVRVLYDLHRPDSPPMSREDPRVRSWEQDWRRLKHLQGSHQRTQRKASQDVPRTAPAVGCALPPGNATIPELEAAREKLRDSRADITERQKQASKDLMLAFESQVRIDAELRQLRETTRRHKQALQEKIMSLEAERAQLGHHIAQLRYELQELQGVKLDITEEESELNDRRAELYFAWARSQEAKSDAASRQLTNHIEQLTSRLADRDQKLAAADQLIVGLRAAEHPSDSAYGH